jgi:hypothetical protein
MANKYMKKIFNTLSYKGNVNQNDIEIPPYSGKLIFVLLEYFLLLYSM